MAKARWRGSMRLNETPDSPSWDFSGDANTITRTFVGPYDVCLSQTPARGSEMQGFSGFTIDKCAVKKSPGGKGTLTVIASGSAQSASSDIKEEKYEVQWTELQKPLMTNPFWLPTMGGALTIADKIAIKQWEDCPDAALKEDYKYYDDNNKGGTAKTLSANAQKYAEKILNGVDSWVLYVPVARKTTLTIIQPNASKAGHKETPTGFGSALPEDYEWFKTADSSTRSGKHGKWERTEEWTAAEEWDSDLYPENVI
jgi:hypothetical protein